VPIAAQTLDPATGRPDSWVETLRASLAPTPGRLNATLRILVATTIVLVTSMTLQVPSIAISLFIVLMLANQNSVVAAIEGILIVVTVTLAAGLTILLLRFTLDHSMLRLVTMALAFFLCMYFARVFVVGPAGTLVAVFVTLTLASVDLFPSSEAIVRNGLWTWVAVVYPAAVTVGVNFLLLPDDPEPHLRREVAARLRAVARAAGDAQINEAKTAGKALAGFASAGSRPLLNLMRLAEIRNPAVRALRSERAARILVLERLVQSAALLPDLAISPAPGQKARLERVAAASDSFATSTVESKRLETIPLIPASHADDVRSALTPVLAQLEELIDEFAVAERPPADRPASMMRLFVPDALTNANYVRFGLKVTLAAMFCYLAYTAVDWNGIHTCMATCTAVALGSTGATIHKATLRLVGSAVGAVTALASVVFVVPHMTSIVPLALLVAVVVLPAAWIVSGSQRTAYLGVQIAFAFYLAVLEGYAPSTNIDELRDRIVGVFFGVTVMALVFSYVWPERAGSAMLQSLTAALRRMAQIGIGLGDTRAALQPARAAAWQALDQTGQMYDLYSFEPEARLLAGRLERKRVQQLIELTRRVLLAQAALVEYGGRGGSPATVGDKRIALDRAVATALERIADRVGEGTSTDPVDLRAPLAALESAAPSVRAADAAFDGEVALCAAVVERVEALRRVAEGP
jgi:multidrug resistance protein MdtO